MRVHIPVRLRWGDLDAYNHVNNVTMLRILEEARVRAFWAPDSADDELRDTAVVEASAGSKTLTLISSHQIEYVKPLDYQRQPVDVQLWFSKLGGASAELCYEVYAKDTLYVRAATTMVFVDAATQRPRRLDARERAAWSPYLGEPVRFAQRGRRAALKEWPRSRNE